MRDARHARHLRIPAQGMRKVNGFWADRRLYVTAARTVPIEMPDCWTTERCPLRTEYIPESNAISPLDPVCRSGQPQIAAIRVVIEAR